MFEYLPLTLSCLALLWISKKLINLRQHLSIAKNSGIPYVISPIDGIAGFLWTAIHDPILNTFKSIPYFRDQQWLMIVEPHKGWNYAQELREAFGEFFLVVSPGQIYMNLSDPAAIIQMTTRRNDFLKPVEIYGIVDIFGRSMLSSEGDEWKRHRKVVAPAFSEKSNALVWKESLKQAIGMLRFWSNSEGNGADSIKINDTAPGTALMTLHVISGAGFGVRQVWEDKDEKELGTKAIPGFNTKILSENHEMAFKDSLNILVHGIIWMAIFPVWFLRILPFKVNKSLMQAYYECGDYFRELFEYKVQLLVSGGTEEKGTMDLMGPLIKASENKPNDATGQYMNEQDVIANSWIFLFAGHETTANTLHFAFLFLSIDLAFQAHLQEDIDSIVGSRPSEEWIYEADMPRLYTGMVGATMNETLRLMPPIIDIPKIVKGSPKPLDVGGKTFMVPTNTFIHINAVGVQRNPKYWPHSPSKISKKDHDLDDFVPGRWLLNSNKFAEEAMPKNSEHETSSDGYEKKAFESEGGLFTPVRGSFIPFSEGARACPGRRFAQVEITAALAVIFKSYTIELDVSRWASDDEIARMGLGERAVVYEKAKLEARRQIRASETVITHQMIKNVPVQFRKRGSERFLNCYL